MKTLITGATSSIGRILVQECVKQGHELRLLLRASSNRSGLDLPGVEFAPGDVTDAASVRAAMTGCERVVHMAAIVGHNVPEAEWWNVNREGSRNVLQAAYDLGVQSMVQVSSISTLGPTQPGELADETRPVNVGQYMNLYQKTKHAADELARDYAARGLNVTIVYPSFGFGCSRATSHPSLQDTTLLRMAAHQPTVIMGSGTNRLCLSYYRDTAAGILAAASRGQRGEDYILGGDNLTFIELWAAIGEVLGQQPPRLRVPIPALKAISQLALTLTGKTPFSSDFFEMIEHSWNFSSDKARRCLGYQPHSFRDAIAETWAEYQVLGWKG